MDLSEGEVKLLTYKLAIVKKICRLKVVCFCACIPNYAFAPVGVTNSHLVSEQIAEGRSRHI